MTIIPPSTGGLLGEDERRRRSQQKAWAILGDLLSGPLPPVEWQIQPLNGAGRLQGTLWEHTAENIVAWARFLGVELIVRPNGVQVHLWARLRMREVDVEVMAILHPAEAKVAVDTLAALTAGSSVTR